MFPSGSIDTAVQPNGRPRSDGAGKSGERRLNGGDIRVAPEGMAEVWTAPLNGNNGNGKSGQAVASHLLRTRIAPGHGYRVSYLHWRENGADRYLAGGRGIQQYSLNADRQYTVYLAEEVSLNIHTPGRGTVVSGDFACAWNALPMRVMPGGDAIEPDVFANAVTMTAMPCQRRHFSHWEIDGELVVDEYGQPYNGDLTVYMNWWNAGSLLHVAPDRLTMDVTAVFELNAEKANGECECEGEGEGEGEGEKPPPEGETPPQEGETPPQEGETPPQEGEGGWPDLSNLTVVGNVINITTVPPTMPQTTVTLSPVNVSAGAEYRFKIGGVDLLGNNLQPEAALVYMDFNQGVDYRNPPVIDSGWLSTPQYTVNWNHNEEVTQYGIYGGRLRYIGVGVREPVGEGWGTPHWQNVELTGDKEFHVVGGALYCPTVNSYINSLTHADLEIEEEPQDIEQLRRVTRGIARWETSDGTHYWAGGGNGIAAHVRYPIRERLENDVAGDGTGIMQISVPDRLDRRVIWDWQANIRRAMAWINDEFYAEAREWRESHPHDPDPVVLRLETYTRYNGGSSSRYYWWNNLDSAVACILVDSGAETHNITVTNFTSLQITASVENLTGINIRGTGDILAQWTGPLPTLSPFTWPSVDITTSQAVYGNNETRLACSLK